MNIVLLGAPGAGKGTQAVKIATRYGIPHISTGDIFRANIKNKTPLGLKVKAIIDAGNLVPDDLTCEIVKARLTEADCANGYILDGFPRTVAQAKALDGFSNVDIVLNFDIDLSKLIKRISGRRVCPACSTAYHVDTLNGSNTCSECGTDLVIRPDDNEESVKTRLNVYTEKTAPLIDYYTKAGNLKTVGAEGGIDEIFEEVIKILG